MATSGVSPGRGKVKQDATSTRATAKGVGNPSNYNAVIASRHAARYSLCQLLSQEPQLPAEPSSRAHECDRYASGDGSTRRHSARATTGRRGSDLGAELGVGGLLLLGVDVVGVVVVEVLDALVEISVEADLAGLEDDHARAHLAHRLGGVADVEEGDAAVADLLHLLHALLLERLVTDRKHLVGDEDVAVDVHRHREAEPGRHARRVVANGLVHE